jgi:site-specific DNA-methyltransferase (adenine-specific)
MPEKLKAITKRVEQKTGLLPFFASHGVILYHSDNFKILRVLEDKSIPLLLTDPPYGTGVMSRNPQKKKAPKSCVDSFQFGRYTWDKVPPKRYFTQMMRISRNQVIFGYQYFKHLETAKCTIVWDKGNGCNNFGDFELAWTSFDKSNKIYRYLWNGMIQEVQSRYYKEKRIHPNQKPTGLFTGILNDFAKKGQIVIDPYAGSGTTGAACLKFGLPCILIEKEFDHCQRAKERLQHTTKQRRLFLS